MTLLVPNMDSHLYNTVGNMDGAVFSVLIDGLTEEGYFADAKVFGSFGWSESRSRYWSYMLGSSMRVNQVHLTGLEHTFL